eukprot:6917699-Pyramimonas_sp.AAC.1
MVNPATTTPASSIRTPPSEIEDRGGGSQTGGWSRVREAEDRRTFEGLSALKTEGSREDWIGQDQ